MGDALRPNFEDPVFASRDNNLIRDGIAERNERFRVWGFKDPNAVRYLEAVYSCLRNPLFVVVERDVVAAANRILRRDKRGRDKLVRDLMQQKGRNVEFALSKGDPTVLVSYEKLIYFPEEFIEELCSYLKLEIPEELGGLVEFLSPGGYKKNGFD
jgi:hypothetical protein